MTKVKICGLTNLEDALVAVEAGADLLGFIFYEPSPRYVVAEAVREIVAGVRLHVAGRKSQVAGRARHATERRPVQLCCLPVGRNTQHVMFIGVFVNATLETITHTLDYCQLDAAQLHGDEPPELVNRFAGRAYKALRPKSPKEAESLFQTYLPCSPAPVLPCFLLDAYHPTLYGGTGHVTDWTIAADIARQQPILLAGSLTPANVAEAIQMVRPWGVDVSSGVEREKGYKDHDKVKEFIRVAKNVEREA